MLASAPPPRRPSPVASTSVRKRTPAGRGGGRGKTLPARPRAARALVLEVVPPLNGRTVAVQTEEDEMGVKVSGLERWGS